MGAQWVCMTTWKRNEALTNQKEPQQMRGFCPIKPQVTCWVGGSYGNTQDPVTLTT